MADPSQPVAGRGPDEPSSSRLADDAPGRDEIVEAHRAARIGGHDGYADPLTGLFVFTSAYLAAQGRCCERGCRHCPFVA